MLTKKHFKLIKRVEPYCCNIEIKKEYVKEIVFQTKFEENKEWIKSQCEKIGKVRIYTVYYSVNNVRYNIALEIENKKDERENCIVKTKECVIGFNT